MKIAIPSEGRDLDSLVNQNFGRTETFILVDSKDRNYRVIDNSAARASGGAGIKAAQTVVDSGADAVIAFRCGENAVDVLSAGGVRIYKASPGTVGDAVEMFNSGILEELTDIHPGFHNHGGA